MVASATTKVGSGVPKNKKRVRFDEAKNSSLYVFSWQKLLSASPASRRKGQQHYYTCCTTANEGKMDLMTYLSDPEQLLCSPEAAGQPVSDAKSQRALLASLDQYIFTNSILPTVNNRHGGSDTSCALYGNRILYELNLKKNIMIAHQNSLKTKSSYKKGTLRKSKPRRPDVFKIAPSVFYWDKAQKASMGMFNVEGYNQHLVT
jgi:hypothetical protein